MPRVHGYLLIVNDLSLLLLRHNGVLLQVDAFMNVSLGEVVCTASDGDRFWKLDDCYVRGTSIKYFRVPDEALAKGAIDLERLWLRPSSVVARPESAPAWRFPRTV